MILYSESQKLTTDKLIEIRAVPQGTDQPLAGTTSVFYNSTERIARFTDLAFLHHASNVKLLFECMGCVNAEGQQLTIETESRPFNITLGFHKLAYISPRPGVRPYEHPNTAGQVKSNEHVLYTSRCTCLSY